MREILTLSGQVRSQPRIARQEKLRPALHEQCLLAFPAAQLFLVGLFPAARGELVVVQLGIGRKYGAEARPPPGAKCLDREAVQFQMVGIDPGSTASETPDS